MIQQKDLRVGNWVLLDDKLFEVDVIVTFADNDFDPIPLTPEILQKCGFAKAEDSFTGYLISIAEDEKIRIVHNGFVWIWPLYANNPVVVNHLHQLQNLYFALTGEELNVQL